MYCVYFVGDDKNWKRLCRIISPIKKNFKRPFTPRGWLGSARNFGKTRFRRFATFDFSTPKKFWARFFLQNVSGVSLVLEERGTFHRHWQIRRQKLLPVVRLFSLYDPWRRGKSGTLCFLGWFWTKNDFNHVGIMLWFLDNIILLYSYDNMILGPSGDGRSGVRVV